MADIRKTFRAWLVEGVDSTLHIPPPPLAEPPLTLDIPSPRNIGDGRREKVRQATVRETPGFECNHYTWVLPDGRLDQTAPFTREDYGRILKQMQQESWHL